MEHKQDQCHEKTTSEKQSTLDSSDDEYITKDSKTVSNINSNEDHKEINFNSYGCSDEEKDNDNKEDNEQTVRGDKEKELVEMKNCRKRGMCCGAGGAQMFKEAEKGNKEIFIENTDHFIMVAKLHRLHGFNYNSGIIL